MNDMHSPISLLKSFAAECREYAKSNKLDAERNDREAAQSRLRASQHIASAEAAERAVALLEAAAGGAA